MMKKIVSIIIPVYNEEKYVRTLLQKVSTIDTDSVWYEKEIIVVNDWSKDESEIIIKDFLHSYNGKYSYLSHTNSGKWYSIKQWIQIAKWDVFIVQDADLEYEPNDIVTMLSYMENKNLDVCYWSRILWYKKYGAQYSTIWFLFWWLLLSFLTTIMTWKLVTDEPTCYKMFKSKCKDILLFIKENDFAWEPAATLSLIKKWYSYWEIPIHYFPRKQMQWKKIKLIDWWFAIKTLFIYRFSRNI